MISLNNFENMTFGVRYTEYNVFATYQMTSGHHLSNAGENPCYSGLGGLCGAESLFSMAPFRLGKRKDSPPLSCF